MKRTLLVLLCGIGFAAYAQIQQADNTSTNQLQKVFHHRMMTDSDVLSHIELAKIVLYFDREPLVLHKSTKPSIKKEFQEMLFFIPITTFKGNETKEMVNALNNASQENYSATVREVKTPAPGIEIKIVYNPKNVLVTYDSFDAITKAKSVEFRLLNKSLLDSLKQKKDQNVLRTTYNAKPIVIIDCGHGGKDPGTSSVAGVAEKDVALAIGKELAKELNKSGFKIVFTRTDDRFIALDERTYIANKVASNAILVSLHANNCPNPQVQGLETFCLASNLFTKNTGLETAIDIMIQASDEQKNLQSKMLAQKVHASILKTIKDHGYAPHDRKVHHAATQMLMGIKWPGILIETDYLSGPAAARLSDPKFQKIYAQGICDGIKACF